MEKKDMNEPPHDGNQEVDTLTQQNDPTTAGADKSAKSQSQESKLGADGSLLGGVSGHKPHGRDSA